MAKKQRMHDDRARPRSESAAESSPSAESADQSSAERLRAEAREWARQYRLRVSESLARWTREDDPRLDEAIIEAPRLLRACQDFLAALDGRDTGAPLVADRRRDRAPGPKGRSLAQLGRWAIEALVRLGTDADGRRRAASSHEIAVAIYEQHAGELVGRDLEVLPGRQTPRWRAYLTIALGKQRDRGLIEMAEDGRWRLAAKGVREASSAQVGARGR